MSLRLSMLLAVALIGCGDKDADSGDKDADSGAAAVDGPTYDDVEPILAAYCTSCHADGGSAPFALDSYADAAAWADRIVARAVDDVDNPMPPSGIAVTEEEAAILVDWVDLGAPE